MAEGLQRLVLCGNDGAMKTDAWVRDSKGWCYIDMNGYSVSDCWVTDSMGKCYINSNGNMVTSDWQKIGGNWYYFEANGSMATGSKTIGGKTYNFNSAGVCLNP